MNSLEIKTQTIFLNTMTLFNVIVCSTYAFRLKTNENLVKEISRGTSQRLNRIILIKREFVCIYFNGETFKDDFR